MLRIGVGIDLGRLGAGGGAPEPVEAPTNTAAPTIIGGDAQGQTIYVLAGTWTGKPRSFEIQWKRNDSPISGATLGSYNRTASDVGATLTVDVTATNAGGSATATAAANATTAATAPGVPTLSAQAGNARVDLIITPPVSDGGSPVIGYAIYEYVNSDGTGTESLVWRYPAPEPDGLLSYNRGVANGVSRSWKIAAINGVGEGVKSSSATATPSAALLNRMRVSAIRAFEDVPILTQTFPFTSGSTVSVVSDDATALTVSALTTQRLVRGTFTAAGTKQLTITETPSAGDPQDTVIPFIVSPRPAPATQANVMSAAQRMLATFASRPSNSVSVGEVTVTVGAASGVAPFGNRIQNNSVPTGYSGPVASAPRWQFNGQGPQTATISAWDPITQSLMNGPAHLGYGRGALKRWRQNTAAFGALLAAGSGDQTSMRLRIRYSENNGRTFKWATEHATSVRNGSGNRWITCTWASGAADRIIELWADEALGIPPSTSVLGWDFPSGTTIAAVPNIRPRMGIWPDSYIFGQGALDYTRTLSSVIALQLGTDDIYNFGIRTNRYSTPATGIMAHERMADGSLGYNEMTAFGMLDFGFIYATINEQSTSDLTMVTDGYRLGFLRWRHHAPYSPLVFVLGFHPPHAGPTINTRNAERLAFSDVFDADAGAILIDGFSGTYRYMGADVALPPQFPTAPFIATGAIGSNPYFNGAGGNVTASFVAATRELIVTDTPFVIQIAQAINGGTGLVVGSKIERQASGTPGGAGTYIVDTEHAADQASQTVAIAGDVDHLNPAGQILAGSVGKEAALLLATLIAA